MKTFFTGVTAMIWAAALQWIGMRLGLADHFWFMLLIVFTVPYLIVPACDFIWKRFHRFDP